MSDSVIKHAYLENEDSDIILAFAADICDSVEKTAVATEAHSKNSWFYSVPVRRLCKATSDIAIGANIVPGNGGNCIAQTIEELMASAINFGDFATTSNVTISGVTYHTYWEVAPTASNQVYGVAVHPTNGKLIRIYNNKGTYTALSYDTDNNTTTGDGIKTKVAKTGAAQSAITPTISAGTTLDNAIATLLNNDATLNADIGTVGAIDNIQIFTDTFDISTASQTISGKNVSLSGFTPIAAIASVNWYEAKAVATVYDNQYVSVDITNKTLHPSPLMKDVTILVFYTKN